MLTLTLGVLYVVAGIVETTRAIVTGDGGLPFWFGTLVGGGALVLLGRRAYPGRPALAGTLVTVGCLAGVLATLWTLVIPLLALVVVILNLMRVSEAQPAAR